MFPSKTAVCWMMKQQERFGALKEPQLELTEKCRWGKIFTNFCPFGEHLHSLCRQKKRGGRHGWGRRCVWWVDKAGGSSTDICWSLWPGLCLQTRISVSEQMCYSLCIGPKLQLSAFSANTQGLESLFVRAVTTALGSWCLASPLVIWILLSVHTNFV